MLHNLSYIEPFRIKSVEPIRLISKGEREEALRRAGYNLFAVPSEKIFIDLLTDSGTSAMSQHQWGALIQGDESYAGSRSYFHLKRIVEKTFKCKYFVPVHQGRGAEHVLFPVLISKEKKFVLGNMHFDTTRAHIQLAGGIPVDLICDESMDTEKYFPFKGNMDTDKLKNFIRKHGAKGIAFILLTITCNSAGGQPVSMENIREVKKIAKKNNILFYLDGARFAENAYFIKTREKKIRNKSIREIVREMFSYADGFAMSVKKDGLVNTGGIIGIKSDDKIYQQVNERLIIYEGFTTYGGLSRRDMEAISVGIEEGMQSDYLDYRIRQVDFLGEKLKYAGIPIQHPVGGHAVFVDAQKMLPNIPWHQFPGVSLANEIYLQGGIRTAEVGSFMLGNDFKTGKQKKSLFEFLRLAVPRRVYTQNHLEYVAEIFSAVQKRKNKLRGYKITYEPKVLRYFTAILRPSNV